MRLGESTESSSSSCLGGQQASATATVGPKENRTVPKVVGKFEFKKSGTSFTCTSKGLGRLPAFVHSPQSVLHRSRTAAPGPVLGLFRLWYVLCISELLFGVEMGPAAQVKQKPAKSSLL